MLRGRQVVRTWLNLFRAQAARQVARRLPGVQVHVFSDRDIAAKAEQIKAALDGADVFFGSLLFDFDQVWLCHPRLLSALPKARMLYSRMLFCALHAMQESTCIIIIFLAVDIYTSHSWCQRVHATAIHFCSFKVGTKQAVRGRWSGCESASRRCQCAWSLSPLWS